MKICSAFLACDFGNGAFDDDLALQYDPRKYKASAWVGLKLTAFAAFVVGVENKAATIETFEEHGASGRAALAIGGGERHGVGLSYFCGFSFLKPFLELAKRIAGEVFFIQPGEGVIFAEVSQAHDDGGACAWR